MQISTKVMHSDNTLKIIADISQFINDRGGDCSEWHIGVTDDPERLLFGERGLPRDHRALLCRSAASPDEAHAIVRGFMNLSCQGQLNNHGQDGRATAVHIYLYHQPPSAHDRAGAAL